MEQTRGPDGAYLVVTPLAQGSCSRKLMRRSGAPSSCNYDAQGYGLGATLRSGEITAVSYRDGHVCHLPAPEGVIVRLAQCPVVGYVPAPGPKYTAQQIAAPVTVRKLPARYYCQRPGIYRPAVLAIPCGDTVPAGYARVEFTPSRQSRGYDPRQNLLIYVSWTAPAASGSCPPAHATARSSSDSSHSPNRDAARSIQCAAADVMAQTVRAQVPRPPGAGELAEPPDPARFDPTCQQRLRRRQH
ncbi:MAG: hypothetical protein ACLPZR_31095 [Solirubrobacteraceae bacterium]